MAKGMNGHEIIYILLCARAFATDKRWVCAFDFADM